MQQKTIREMIPKRKEYYNLHTKIDKNLSDQVNEIREKENLSWSDLIEACLKKFVDEVKGLKTKK